MKVILLQDVAKIGKRSEVVEVPDGYAMNKLIPQRMAEPATVSNKKRIEQAQATQAAAKSAHAQLFTSALASLEANVLEIPVEANEKEHLFQAVHASDIAAAVQAERGFALTAEMIEVTEPIKSLGEHTVTLTAGDEKGTFTVIITKKS